MIEIIKTPDGYKVQIIFLFEKRMVYYYETWKEVVAFLTNFEEKKDK